MEEGGCVMEMPRTFEESLDMLEEITKMMIAERPHQKKLLKRKLKEMKKELTQQHKQDIRFVPMEINDYSFFTKLSDEEMLDEHKKSEYLKELFKNGQLSFKKTDSEESIVHINSSILSEFGIFEGEFLPVRELMQLVGLSNSKGEVA